MPVLDIINDKNFILNFTQCDLANFKFEKFNNLKNLTSTSIEIKNNYIRKILAVYFKLSIFYVTAA